MKKISRAKADRKAGGFSLVEVLTVISIIAILAALTVAAFSGVQKTALRDRARNEIGAIGAALENYKADNGSYPTPPAAIFPSTNSYTTAFPNTAGGLYQLSSEYLYEQLSGYTNSSYMFGALTKPDSHVYYTFTPRQLGNNSAAAAGPVFIQDPFGNSYGYYDGNGTAPPVNGTNQYDLWSTAGDTGAANVPGWVTDWGN